MTYFSEIKIGILGKMKKKVRKCATNRAFFHPKVTYFHHSFLDKARRLIDITFVTSSFSYQFLYLLIKINTLILVFNDFPQNRIHLKICISTISVVTNTRIPFASSI